MRRSIYIYICREKGNPWIGSAIWGGFWTFLPKKGAQNHGKNWKSLLQGFQARGPRFWMPILDSDSCFHIRVDWLYLQTVHLLQLLLRSMHAVLMFEHIWIPHTIKFAISMTVHFNSWILNCLNSIFWQLFHVHTSSICMQYCMNIFEIHNCRY